MDDLHVTHLVAQKSSFFKRKILIFHFKILSFKIHKTHRVDRLVDVEHLLIFKRADDVVDPIARADGGEEGVAEAGALGRAFD